MESVRLGLAAGDVGLGGEVHDELRPGVDEHLVDQRSVGDVGMEEGVPGIARVRRDALRAARVREEVDVQDRSDRTGEPVPDEVRAEEAGSAGYEDASIGCSVGHAGCCTSYQAMVSASDTTATKTISAAAW